LYLTRASAVTALAAHVERANARGAAATWRQLPAAWDADAGGCARGDARATDGAVVHPTTDRYKSKL
jgi:hypothetical protein